MKVRLESTSGSSDLEPDVGDARFHGGDFRRTKHGI